MNIIENTEATLKSYIEYVGNNDSLRDHDRRFAEHSKHLEKKFKKLAPPLNVISKRLYKISKNTFYLIELFDYKIYLLAKGALQSIETRNPLTLANTTRAIMEQIAVYHHCLSSISIMLENLKDQGTLEKITKIIEKCENTINRTYSGQGKAYAENGAKAIHVNEAIKSLTEEISDALKVYDYLCEFVHPNYGGNLLVSSGDLGKGIIAAKRMEDKNIEKMLDVICSVFDYLSFKKLVNPTLMWSLEHYVELCMMPKAKLSSIFSVKKAVPVGDGKTIKSAFFFKNARTSQEAMRLMYQYLADIGYEINPNDRQQVTDIESIRSGYHIDLWRTNIGEVYFKTMRYSGI
ncbi:hypothetical protein CWO04_22420 [Vibrio splendidus]|uniref:hypothetical protein n=1 Tax=Vibrio splendidus TaxID=29497 RepID=UPI000D34F481|nr:hypothetical protein [Vibrio splendidus]PTP81557.1 hypothetical protein CWO04_22420 [Vibrio splendidus]